MLGVGKTMDSQCKVDGQLCAGNEWDDSIPGKHEWIGGAE